MDDNKGHRFLVVFSDQRRIYLNEVENYTLSDSGAALWVDFVGTYERALIPLNALAYIGPEEFLEERGNA